MHFNSLLNKVYKQQYKIVMINSSSENLTQSPGNHIWLSWFCRKIYCLNKQKGVHVLADGLNTGI